jgi:hypothetical protein
MINEKLHSINKILDKIIKEQVEPSQNRDITVGLFADLWKEVVITPIDRVNVYDMVTMRCNVAIGDKVMRLYRLIFEFFSTPTNIKIMPVDFGSPYVGVYIQSYDTKELRLKNLDPFLSKYELEKEPPIKRNKISHLSADHFLTEIDRQFKINENKFKDVSRKSAKKRRKLALDKSPTLEYFITGENLIKFNSELERFMVIESKIISIFKQDIVNNKKVIDLLTGNLDIDELFAKYHK